MSKDLQWFENPHAFLNASGMITKYFAHPCSGQQANQLIQTIVQWLQQQGLKNWNLLLHSQ